MKKQPKLRFPGFTDDWEQRKLGDVIAELKSGLSRQLENTDIGLPVVRANNINDGRLDMENDVKYWYKDDPQGADTSNYLIHKNDILINFINSETKMGTATIVNTEPTRDTIYTTNILKMKADDTASDSLFLFYLTMTYHYCNYIKSITKPAVNQASFTTIDYKNYLFLIPSLEEQKKIGAYFSKLDNLITLHQRELDEWKDFKKGMLQKMFPKKGKSKPELRFPGFTDDWEQRKLGEVATFINGRAYSQDELLHNGKYKVLRVGNFYTNDSWYYSDMELDEKYYANDGDLLYTWSATFGPHIWNGGKVIYHYHIWKVDLSDMLEKRFAVQLLEQDKAKILSDKNGSTMVHITKSGMEQKEVLLPSSVAEQTRIGAYFENLDNLITLHQQQLEYYKELKKALLQQMFV